MKYKHTINIPKTNFSMKANLTQNEKRFREFWNQIDLWGKVNVKSSKKNFILHDGPPYANGNIHVGHALNKILKDCVLRYKVLRGYSVDYIPGWDAHGLPIENKVEKTENYKNLSDSEKRNLCKEYALSQIKSQKSQFEKLHLLTNFKEIYKTIDAKYIEKELEILLQLIENEMLYWKLKPTAWSWSSKTALAESELIYQEIEENSIYFWFPTCTNDLMDDEIRILIWTTTPYTLEANLGCVVHPEFEYEVVENHSNKYLCLKGYMRGRVLKTLLGKELEGIEYWNPITNEKRKIMCDTYVKKGKGTGIIHTAPGHGIDDYKTGLKYNLEAYCSINDEGYFNNKNKFNPINNKFYKEASEITTNWLKENGYLFREEKIKHSIGHDWRTGKPTLYKASPQWFLDINKAKDELDKNYPEFSKPEWLYEKTSKLIKSREEWCISRQRVWGVPIPILFDETGPILEINQIKYTIDKLKKHGIESWFKEKPEFFLHEKTLINGELKKSKDILDVWFDSGCSWSILKGEKADLYIEGTDQLRGWFNSSSTICLLTKKQIPFNRLIGHGFVLDGEGNKMSKSKGNVIDPIEIVEKYGADILRLWLVMNDYTDDIKLSEQGIEKAISTYKKIRNILFKYSLSIIPENFVFNPETLNDLKILDSVKIYKDFTETNKKCDEFLEKYEFFNAINTYMKFINEYSSWYLEINKEEIYCGNQDGNKILNEVFHIVWSVLKRSIVFFSIFIPQTSEEAHMHLKEEKGYLGPESVSLENL